MDHGLTENDLWLYLHADEAGPAPDEDLEVRCRPDPDTAGATRLELVVEGAPVGYATVSVPRGRCGVLWWLEVDEEHRGRGLGRQLLRAARRQLAQAGAAETILVVDHAERNRQSAVGLYQSEGFALVDHLCSYRSPETPRCRRPAFRTSGRRPR